MTDGALGSRFHELYVQGIAKVQQADPGSAHQSVITLMKRMGASESTAENRLAGVSDSRGEHLIALILRSDAALNTFLLMALGESTVVSMALPSMRERLMMAVDTIDLSRDRPDSSV